MGIGRTLEKLTFACLHVQRLKAPKSGRDSFLFNIEDGPITRLLD